MSSKDKHITRPEDFLKYAANKMNREERHAFEKNLQKDPFDYDASEGLSSISTDEAKRDLLDITSRIQKRTKSARNLIWYRIAASVAFLAIVSSVFYTVIKNRIEKGTGQLIVSEIASPQKEEKEISNLQTNSSKQPADAKPDIIGTGRGKKIIQTPLKNAGTAKKSESTEVAPVQEEKAETIIESEDLITGEVSKSATLAVPESKEMIIQEEKSENIEVQALMIRPKTMKPIKGIVLSSEDTTPLPGVSVMVKGTNQGTVTDIHGLFTLPASQDSTTILVAQFIGMERKETKLEDNTFVKIEMDPDNLSLSEVVVVGYGARNRFSSKSSGTKKDQIQIPASHPVPVNGPDGFNEYVRKNHVFPSTNLKITRAKVILNFLVRINGRPDSIIVVKSPGEEFSVEAIRLLKEGPGWIPATKNGKKVAEAVQVKIILNSTKE